MYNGGSERKYDIMKIKNKIHIEANYNLPNKFHLCIQTKYRLNKTEDKTKYKRCRDKRNYRKEISTYL